MVRATHPMYTMVQRMGVRDRLTITPLLYYRISFIMADGLMGMSTLGQKISTAKLRLSEKGAMVIRLAPSGTKSFLILQSV